MKFKEGDVITDDDMYYRKVIGYKPHGDSLGYHLIVVDGWGISKFESPTEIVLSQSYTEEYYRIHLTEQISDVGSPTELIDKLISL